MIRWLAIWFSAGLCASCAVSGLSSPEKSPSDALYALNQGSAPAAADLPVVASFYRKVLSPVLSTQCEWLPTDSEYALRINRRCGPLFAVAKSTARYMSEFDANLISSGVVILENRTRFFDLDESCAFF